MKTKKQEIIDAFKGTDFGGDEKSISGMYRLIAKCIMKRFVGYRSGSTIISICKDVGFITDKGNTTKLGRMFAYDVLVTGFPWGTEDDYPRPDADGAL